MIFSFIYYSFRTYIISSITFLLLLLFNTEYGHFPSFYPFAVLLFLNPFTICVNFFLDILPLTHFRTKDLNKLPVKKLFVKYLPIALIPSLLISFVVLILNDWYIPIEGKLILFNFLLTAQFGFYQFLIVFKNSKNENRSN